MADKPKITKLDDPANPYYRGPRTASPHTPTQAAPPQDYKPVQKAPSALDKLRSAVSIMADDVKAGADKKMKKAQSEYQEARRKKIDGKGS